MMIVRVKKDARYFSASNEPFNDTRLSWEARGLMGYLLSKPNDWEVRMTDLEKQGPAGNFKLRRMLAELRKCGYMNRIRVTLEGGKFDWITEVYESPTQNPNPSKKILKTSGGKTTSGSSTSGKPRDILSTERISTDNNIDSAIFTALSEQTGGMLNTDTPRYVDTWKEKHPLEWILKAIGIAKDKGIHGAGVVRYVDSILVGWSANGYPKTYDEKVAARRNGKTTPIQDGIANWLAQKEATNGNS